MSKGIAPVDYCTEKEDAYVCCSTLQYLLVTNGVCLMEESLKGPMYALVGKFEVISITIVLKALLKPHRRMHVITSFVRPLPPC